MILFNLVIELIFTPVVDKDFLIDQPMNLIKRKQFHCVPSLMGTNLDEGTLVALRAFPRYLNRVDPPTMSLDEFREALPTYLYYPSPSVLPAVEQWYIDWTKADNSSADFFDEFIQLQTDQVYGNKHVGLMNRENYWTEQGFSLNNKLDLILVCLPLCPNT